MHTDTCPSPCLSHFSCPVPGLAHSRTLSHVGLCLALSRTSQSPTPQEEGGFELGTKAFVEGPTNQVSLVMHAAAHPVVCILWSELSKLLFAFTISPEVGSAPTPFLSRYIFTFCLFSLGGAKGILQEITLSLPQIPFTLTCHCVLSVCFQGENGKICHRSNSRVCFPRQATGTSLPCAASSTQEQNLRMRCPNAGPQDRTFPAALPLEDKSDHLRRQDPSSKPSEPRR